MNFKRKHQKLRFVSPFNCSCCSETTAHMPSYLKMAINDRRRYQSANAQIRCDSVGSRPSFRHDAKSLTGMVVDW